jgi:hypothetical protein
MKSKILLFSLFSVTLFALATTITLVFNTAPDSPKLIVGFFASVLVTVFGLIYLLIYGLQYWRYRSVAPWQATLLNLRLSFIGAMTFVALLLMSAYEIVTPATVIIVLIIAVLTELVWRRRTAKI